MSRGFHEVIRDRRSVRNFLSREVSKDVLRKTLRAATWAPSAHNAQPWRFIVITDHDTKQRLSEAMASKWSRDLVRDDVPRDAANRLVEDSVELFTMAPVLVIAALTTVDMNNYPDRRRQNAEYTMAVQSLAAAVQNILLTAHSEGLGSCWFCAPLFCQDVVRSVLGIPGNVEPQALIALGYPSGRTDPPPRKALSQIAYKDSWGGEF
jgi:coenzyme F420-0:L-glutamate ligase/coenzyme F420-1:gamma-L-glutamate ligase